MTDDDLFRGLPPASWTKRTAPKQARGRHRARNNRLFCKLCVEPKEHKGPNVCTECVERLEAAYVDARTLFPGVAKMTLPELLERLIAFAKRKAKK